MPKVESIEREGSFYNLIVGFVPPGSTWGMDLNDTKYEPEPAKYMTYRLMETEDGYIISSVSELSEEELSVWMPEAGEGRTNTSSAASSATESESSTTSGSDVSMDLDKTT